MPIYDEHGNHYPEPRPEVRQALDNYYAEVGRRVSVLMEEQEIDDTELAVWCGVSTKCIRRLKAGRRGYVHGKVLCLVAQALGVEVEVLDHDPPQF